MKKILPKYPRILAIAPSTRGFGFAVVEGINTLADWGVKSTKGNKTRECLLKVDDLISHYHPDVIVLEDASAKGSRRSRRIRVVIQAIAKLASTRSVLVKLFSRQEVRRFFFSDAKGTKHAQAEILANRFSEELGFRLPPKRLAYMNEAYQMGIFDAVALAFILRQSR